MDKRTLISESFWAVLFFVLGLTVIIASGSIQTMVLVEKSSIVNSRFFPRVVGIMFCLMSVAMAAGTWSRRFINGGGGSGSYAYNAPFRFWATIGFGIFYILLLKPLGFLIVSWLMLLLLFLVLGIRSKLLLAVLPVLVPLGIFVVFRMLLNVPLPMGILIYL